MLQKVLQQTLNKKRKESAERHGKLLGEIKQAAEQRANALENVIAKARHTWLRDRQGSGQSGARESEIGSGRARRQGRRTRLTLLELPCRPGGQGHGGISTRAVQQEPGGAEGQDG
jgi:hypothetical protein